MDTPEKGACDLQEGNPVSEGFPPDNERLIKELISLLFRRIIDEVGKVVRSSLLK